MRKCLVQMESIVHEYRSFGENVAANIFGVHILKLHVDESLLVEGGPRPYIDPARSRPLMMSFCRFFGVAVERSEEPWRQLRF